MTNWTVSNSTLLRITEQFGTPCFVYDLDQVRQRIIDVQSAFEGRFIVSFAVKSNPNPALLRSFRGQVEMLDVSSVGEIEQAIQAAWPANSLSFTGPAKREQELDAAVRHGIGHIVIESTHEAMLLDKITHARSSQQSILIRISPAKMPAGFAGAMSGKPSQFGIDEEDSKEAITQIKRLDHLKIDGFHIYCGTQCLKAEAIAQYYEMAIALFRRLSNEHDIRPRQLIFGSGLGIPYHEGDQSLDRSVIARKICPAIDDLLGESRFANTLLILETGRYLIGEAGVYLTRVLNTKRSRGTDICIMDGGMHHHLGAAGHLGSVIQRNYRMFKVSTEPESNAFHCYDLCGPLCTSIDTLARSVKLPELKIGDIVAIHCSGAYGLTASPINFISHPLPSEVMVSRQGGIETVIEATSLRHE